MGVVADGSYRLLKRELLKKDLTNEVQASFHKIKHKLCIGWWNKLYFSLWLHESTCYGFGFGFEHVSEIDVDKDPIFFRTTDKDPLKKVNGLISYLGNANVISGEASWAFNESSLRTEK